MVCWYNFISNVTAKETNDPDLEVKSVELLNKVALEEERVIAQTRHQNRKSTFIGQNSTGPLKRSSKLRVCS